jgi:hypothetical protein
MMIRTGTRTVLFTVGSCLLLAGCGPAKPSTAAAGANPAATSDATSSASTPAVTTGGGGDGLTACDLVTEQDAKTAIGSATGPGTPGGTAALSECIHGDGALIVGMKTDSKALYEKSHSAAHDKGATDVPGVGDGAFEAGTDRLCTLEFLKGTTLVSIIFSGASAQAAAVSVAKVAASKM